MRKKMEKQSAQKLAAGIFTAVMVLLCAALYFFTKNASPFANTAAEAPSSPPPTVRPLAAAEDFVEGKGFYAPLSQNDGVFSYSLEGAPLGGSLSLSTAQEGVGEFVLRVARPLAPKEPDKNASQLTLRLYKEKQEAYQAQVDWLSGEALSLLLTLDVKDGVSQSDREAFLFALESTISDGKNRNLNCGDIAVQVIFHASGDEPLVITALLETPKPPAV